MNRDFYIGYQKDMPPQLAAFLRSRVIILLVFAVALAVVLSWAQQPFAQATFEFGVIKSFRGFIHEHPYPILTLDHPDGMPSSGVHSRYLLVAPGKHGALTLFAGSHGKYVELHGSLIYRDNRSMIEVIPSSIKTVSDQIPPPGHMVELGMFTLRGEIVDSKCFLGVMKPGNLKPHKACAIRCISGGIPPLLCVRDEQGHAVYILLAGPDGEAINREVLPFIAESVEVTGVINRMNGLLVMKMNPDMIRRL